MRAVILAAGRGSRMGGLCHERPKCMVQLAGKPLFERQIAALSAGGADQIGAVRGCRAEMIDYPGLSYFTNERWAETNIVMSLAAAASWMRSGTVIVSYGDIFYRRELVRALANAPGELVVALRPELAAALDPSFRRSVS
jgi:L-glutamine-phosphate cytidylyltransferase